MFKFDESTLEKYGAKTTYDEIIQQPELWRETKSIYDENIDAITAFLDSIVSDQELRVIFTGAGTSEYAGNLICDYLNSKRSYSFESIGTTDLVSNPHLYFRKEVPTLLVSFARSGNSPESLAALDLANSLVNNIYHLAITCAREGKLAVNLSDKDNAYVLLMPDKSNDRGFAMTGSFTCMVLSALLIFDKAAKAEVNSIVENIIDAAEDAISKQDKLEEIVSFDFNRIVYLGSGPLYKLANEARLKILELTAGQVVTCNESSMGFRHGPKSFIDENTFIVSFLSGDDYTRKYDLDILEEIYADGIAKKILSLSSMDLDLKWDNLKLDIPSNIPDVYLALPYVLIAQLIALMTAIRIGNTPDNPSKTGTVNRVVKGVIIHEL